VAALSPESAEKVQWARSTAAPRWADCEIAMQFRIENESARRQGVVWSCVLALLAAAGLAQTSTPTRPPAARRHRIPAPRETPTPTDAQLAQGKALVEKAAQAMGGASVIDPLKTLLLKGTSRRSTVAGEIEVSQTTWIRFPYHYRQETALPGGVVTLVVAPTGAFLEGSLGSAEIEEDQRRSIEAGILRNPIALLKTRMAYLFRAVPSPPVTTGGRRLERVLTLVGNEATTLFLDPQTGRIVRLEFPGREEVKPGKMGLKAVVFRDFREVSGLVYPFESEGFFNGKRTFLTKLESVKVNEPMPDALFAVRAQQSPAPAAAPPPLSPSPAPSRPEI